MIEWYYFTSLLLIFPLLFLVIPLSPLCFTHYPYLTIFIRILFRTKAAAYFWVDFDERVVRFLIDKIELTKF